jgi:sugar (pentulose or hexulose) kinase
MLERSRQYFLGLDIGSTTVKAVAIDAATDAILWSDYQRHET